jgi:lipopolysaccharide/colanic/teichoic acid biosynthesis glycosyltransferase
MSEAMEVLMSGLPQTSAYDSGTLLPAKISLQRAYTESGSRDLHEISVWAKRWADIVLASAALILMSPLLLLVAALSKWSSPGPVLFVQKRIGYGCRVFPMLKFRTMVVGAEKAEVNLAADRPGHTFLKVMDDPRVTSLGRFLRRYSIDELPQLWNVIRADMSLVGPRPLLLSDFRKLPLREQMRRFSVPPGMTGLWQISGRSRTTDKERMALDLRYVDLWSLGLDIQILGRTLPVVLRATGAV